MGEAGLVSFIRKQISVAILKDIKYFTIDLVGIKNEILDLILVVGYLLPQNEYQ